MKTVTVWVLLMISSQNTNGAVSFVIDNLPSLEACEKLAAEMEEKGDSKFSTRSRCMKVEKVVLD